MIIVQGSIPIRSECREQAIAMAKEMILASRSELGCISYEFYTALSDPNCLVLFQEWEDAESLQAHYATPHMDAFLRRLPDILDGEIITRRYAVQSVEEEQAVVVAAEKPTIH